MDTFERLESEVRSYCRGWPATFAKAQGHLLYDEHGAEYIDFFAGAGALNYGHNNRRFKRKLIEYLESDSIVHSLDAATVAKREFLERFEEVILMPRGMQYKIQFPGPTGTNSVEAALKLARKYTGRQKIVGFTNAFHGMTLGSLAVTGNAMKRDGAGIALGMGVSMPYAGYLGDGDTLSYLEKQLNDGGSGLDTPAAVIVETVQAEGGMRAASREWLERLGIICRAHEILFIIDDIQVGCGRTGPFFSFEGMSVDPDMICLSKSLSGYGLPMAITLLKPEIDVWDPGEHNCTFRGNNPAFVTAIEALSYWESDSLRREVDRKAKIVEASLEDLITKYPDAKLSHRGRGLLQGLMSPLPGFAEKVCREAFRLGLILETSGPEGEVVKLLPPLTIDDEGLAEGLRILHQSFSAAMLTRQSSGELVASKA